LRVTGSQGDLVARLPRAHFRSAEPNRGHCEAAALLREGALADVVTLNFDLALSTAIAQIGGDEIRQIQGPEFHSDLGRTNLIYLHRNVNWPNAEDWILTTDALRQAWGDGKWETVIMRRSAAVPVVVFAGLGSRAEVLERSVAQIREAAENAVFLVEPGALEDSEFFTALDLGEESHIPLGWVEFMDALAERVAVEHRNALLEACRAQARREGWAMPDLVASQELLDSLDILELGQFRADLTLSMRTYAPSKDIAPEHLADLLLAFELVTATLESEGSITGPGTIEFSDAGGRRVCVVGFASGRGLRSELSIEAELQTFVSYRRVKAAPATYIVSGINDSPIAVSAPEDLISESDSDDLITGPGKWTLVTAHEVQANPDLITSWLS
jgi:hypothetical protein